MKTIHIRIKVESDTLHLPELRDLIGKPVEIIVVELQKATREEVFLEAMHRPENAEEYAAQQTKFRSWLSDPRYEFLWPMIERMVDPPASNGAGVSPAHRSTAS
jgi:hypothetical protein